MRKDDCVPAARRRAVWPRLRALVALVLVSGCSKAATGKFIWMDELPASEIGSSRDSYVTGPGDVVSVSVFNHPELSGRLKVRLDGFVTLPLVGDVPAAGKTLPVLTQDVAKMLEVQKIVVGPRVSIVLDEVAPIKLSILGEVKTPGLYTLEAGAGLAEALATSGGFTEFAHRDRLFIIRRVPELVRIRFRYADLTAANGAAIRFRLKAGDTMLVQ